MKARKHSSRMRAARFCSFAVGYPREHTLPPDTLPPLDTLPNSHPSTLWISYPIWIPYPLLDTLPPPTCDMSLDTLPPLPEGICDQRYPIASKDMGLGTRKEPEILYPREQNDRHTHLKTLPSRNYCCGR